MEIFLPKTVTGGEEKDKTEWEAIAHSSSATQRDQINLFASYFSILSAKTKEIDDKVREIDGVKNEASKTLERLNSVQGIVFYGFVVMVFMLAALIFAYIEFVYSGSKNDDYKYGLSERVINSENDIKSLKKCLSASRWLSPLCLDN